MNLARTIILTNLVVLTLVGSVSGQVIPGLSYSGALNGYFQTWDITEGEQSTTINQLIVPISVFLPVSDRIDIRIASSYASFGRDIEGGNSESVNGLTDVRIQANYVAFDRRLLVGLVGNLPTGQAELTSAEQDIVFEFISPDLAVRANRLGEGFNIGGTLTFANPVSSAAVISVGGGLIARGGYDTSFPTSEDPVRFEPGILANGSAGVDFYTGTSHLHLSSIFSYFGTERVDDADFYRIGSQIAVVARYGLGYARSRGRFTGGLHQIIRLDNSSAVPDGFGTEPLSTNGTYLAVSATNEYAVTPIVTLAASAVARIVGKNDFDTGDSTVFEGGLGVSVIATRGVLVSLGGRFVSGSGTGLTGLDRDLTGIEGSFRLVAQLPQ